MKPECDRSGARAGRNRLGIWRHAGNRRRLRGEVVVVERDRALRGRDSARTLAFCNLWVSKDFGWESGVGIPVGVGPLCFVPVFSITASVGFGPFRCAPVQSVSICLTRPVRHPTERRPASRVLVTPMLAEVCLNASCLWRGGATAPPVSRAERVATFDRSAIVVGSGNSDQLFPEILTRSGC
jgi:hypothetical protein